MYRLQGIIHLSLYVTAIYLYIKFDLINFKLCNLYLYINYTIIDFKYFISNLHCCILAQISVLIPILVCMGLGFFGLSGKVFRLGFVQIWVMSVTFQVTGTDI